MFHADIGFVPAPEVMEINGSIIRPITECTDEQISKLSRGMIEMYGTRIGITEAEEMTHYIKRNWHVSGGDSLFVMTDAETGSLNGCVAVDRKNFFPFIGNLYVVPEKRLTGLSRHLMDYAERYVSSGLKFDKSRLWCEEALIVFYEKRGYVEESRDAEKSLVIMVKNIPAARRDYDQDGSYMKF